MKVYGIPNCTTVKKARAWLDAQGVAYEFVDFKRTPPERAEVERWVRELGWENVLNRRGTTWRKLDPAEQARVVDARSATDAMLAHPSAIKRPVVDREGELLIGFDEDQYASRFATDVGRRARARNA